jgi:cyclophilin family peptidyl-prolyl cis-trans isomerase
MSQHTPSGLLDALEPRLLMAAKPTFAVIPDASLLGGSPLLIPIDGYDKDGTAIKYTVKSSNAQVKASFTARSNPALKLQVAGFGAMTFQLFADLSPLATNHVAQLASSGFYDGLIFHRVINDFMIQGGDPNGDGSGGSSLGEFDDQFHPDLQHNTTGLLSMAKAQDDGNDSQFFITEGPTRHLDFNHAIFGILTEGEAVREAISNVAVDGNDKPTSNVVITKATVVKDTQNAVLMLKAPAGYTGTTTITVTATDPTGKKTVRSFDVTVTPDTLNGGPYLKSTPVVVTAQDQPVTFQLPAYDIEDDDFYFDAVVASQSSEDFTFDIDHDTGLVTVTPPTGFQGTLHLYAGVSAADGSNTNDTWDTQSIPIYVLAPDSAGATPAAALDLGNVSKSLPQGTVTELVNKTSDPIDVYRVKLTKAGSFSAAILHLTDNAKLQLLNQSGKVLATSDKPGLKTEVVTKSLAKGVYYLKVTAMGDNNAAYILDGKLSAAKAGNTAALAASLSLASLAQPTATWQITAMNPLTTADDEATWELLD